MLFKSVAAALVTTALLGGAAFAQTPTKDRSDTNVAVHRDGEWRSSKLIGVDVYNDANEKIGAIEELIVDKSSKVENRSEERRVGKECRSRWSLHHEKTRRR